MSYLNQQKLLMEKFAQCSNKLNTLRLETDKVIQELHDAVQDYQSPFVTAEKSNAMTIIEAVCNEYGTVPMQVMGLSRDRMVCDARHTAMALIRERITYYTLKEIGKLFSNRRHDTVMHSIAQFKSLNKTDAEFAAHTKNILHHLNSI